MTSLWFDTEVVVGYSTVGHYYIIKYGQQWSMTRILILFPFHFKDPQFDVAGLKVYLTIRVTCEKLFPQG